MDEKVNNNCTNNSILKHLFYLQIAELNEAYLPGNGLDLIGPFM